MEWTEVESSTVSRIAYEDDALFVEFRSGVSYRYDDVPPEVYDELFEADSIGRAFHRLVKLGGYEYERLAADAVAVDD